ncbi:hypothetical protein CK203_006887 [Vitis vinifera]|uniref:Uncharacterized protein n=1 Tax=Vitis vinifera TaxID=29760 RepID=A0A438KBY7_VITVI|nr:hypothetical protein CK203_088548 [Vitis vinifera]RVX18714.1 hypothetical protein CK203_006887 [Vitis vinifera]
MWTQGAWKLLSQRRKCFLPCLPRVGIKLPSLMGSYDFGSSVSKQEKWKESSGGISSSICMYGGTGQYHAWIPLSLLNKNNQYETKP